MRSYRSHTLSSKNSFLSILTLIPVSLRLLALMRSAIVVQVDLHLDIRVSIVSGILSPHTFRTLAAKSLRLSLSHSKSWLAM